MRPSAADKAGVPASAMLQLFGRPVLAAGGAACTCIGAGRGCHSFGKQEPGTSASAVAAPPARSAAVSAVMRNRWWRELLRIALFLWLPVGGRRCTAASHHCDTDGAADI